MLKVVSLYDDFERIFTSVLNHHLPKKKKVIRDNRKSHMNKEIRKVIMSSSKLKNKANKTKVTADIAVYKKQRNYIVRLNKESKLNYFDSLDTKKGFLVFVSLIFSNINTEIVSCWLKKITNRQWSKNHHYFP